MIFYSCTLKEVDETKAKKTIVRDNTNSAIVNPIKNNNDNIMPLKLVTKKMENTPREEKNNGYDPPELKTCPTCGANTYGEIYKCNECGTSVCDSCAYYGDTDLNKEGALEIDKHYCSKCYEKLYAAEIAEKPDNTTLLELLTSELEMDEGDDN